MVDLNVHTSITSTCMKRHVDMYEKIDASGTGEGSLSGAYQVEGRRLCLAQKENGMRMI